MQDPSSYGDLAVTGCRQNGRSDWGTRPKADAAECGRGLVFGEFLGSSRYCCPSRLAGDLELVEESWVLQRQLQLPPWLPREGMLIPEEIGR